MSLRAVILFLLPSPLLLGALLSLMTLNPGRLALFMASYAVLMLGASLTRQGHKAQAAFAARTVARPPAIPRKLLGALATGAGVAGATWLGAGGPAVGPDFTVIAFGALALTLHLMSFGIDPMRSKGLEGLSGEALDAAVTKLETARRLVGELAEASTRFGDAALAAKAQALAAAALSVIEKLERDPGDMRRARRFLAVYLVGARDATVGFAQNWADDPDPEIAARYGVLLDDLAAHFGRTAEALGQNDRVALDIEIDVLRERLKMEGV